jgi:dipeptidyl aminopeptidase/acylaminoacyl peptidase
MKIHPLITTAALALAIALTAVPCTHAQDAASRARAAAILKSTPPPNPISSIAISPNGGRVAYVALGHITITPPRPAGADTVMLDTGLSPRDLAWSADSERIAFIADTSADAPTAQIYTASAWAKDVKKIAELRGYVQSPRFSPDGKSVAFLYTENMPRVAGPLEPMTPLAGEIDSHIYEQRIATVDLATGKVAQISAPDMYVYEFDWTPDGKSFAAIAAHGEGDSNWYIAHIYTVDAASGATRDIYSPKYQIAQPHVSPDGKSVAFIEGLMSDQGSTGGDIFLLPVAGGTPRNLTPALDASPSALAWTSPDQILFAEHIDGGSGFSLINVANGAVALLWTGESVVRPRSENWIGAGAPITAGNKAAPPLTAILRESSEEAPEVWAGPIGNWTQLTQINEGPDPKWGEIRNVHWTNGATRVQGWLRLPSDYDAASGKKYPLVVTVHGGPSAACSNNWDPFIGGPLARMGYFVLCPNPRGSYGQGEGFVRGNVKDFGGGDFQDIMAGVDQLLKDFPIDPKRLGIYGHSYGGYMTMWAETQTNRFAAAVAGAGLSDWLSYYGVNDLDQWMIPFFGASIYDDPAVYAKSDPMHFVKNVKTPTLILVGDRDGEVPPEQSVEWWHALKTANVPVTLVVYPNEGHGMVVPANRNDYFVRMLAWFDQWFSKTQ